MIWEQGLEQAPEHPILRETIERIKGDAPQ
jgi:hypothetical protein